MNDWVIVASAIVLAYAQVRDGNYLGAFGFLASLWYFVRLRRLELVNDYRDELLIKLSNEKEILEARVDTLHNYIDQREL